MKPLPTGLSANSSTGRPSVLDRKAIVSAVSHCHQIGMTVLAEGVGTATEAELLIEVGVARACRRTC